MALVVALVCASPSYAQKPLTKPEKPTQTAPAPKSSSSTTSGKSNNKNTTTKENDTNNSASSQSQTNSGNSQVWTSSSSSSSSSQQSQSNSSTSSLSTSSQQSQTNSSVQPQTSKPTTGYINGHEYVDLGLSVKWATCNVGATSPSDYGNYYAWGEIRTKSSYTPENSETYGKIIPTPNENGEKRSVWLYNNLKNNNYDVGDDYSSFKEHLSNENDRRQLYDVMSENGYKNLPSYEDFSSQLGYGVWANEEASSIVGSATYDAARANWGGTWRLPTKDEMDELIDKCKREWTTQGGHNGYKITGPNGNSIFLPAAGWRGGSSLYGAGEYGDYWSATPNEDGTNGAFSLGFYSSCFSMYWSYRNFGQSVRPVSE